MYNHEIIRLLNCKQRKTGSDIEGNNSLDITTGLLRSPTSTLRYDSLSFSLGAGTACNSLFENILFVRVHSMCVMILDLRSSLFEIFCLLLSYFAVCPIMFLKGVASCCACIRFCIRTTVLTHTLYSPVPNPLQIPIFTNRVAFFSCGYIGLF